MVGVVYVIVSDDSLCECDVYPLIASSYLFIIINHNLIIKY